MGPPPIHRNLALGLFTKEFLLRWYFSYNNPVQHDRFGAEWLGNCPAEKDLEVLVDSTEHKPECAQVVNKTNGILVCTSKCVASRTRAVIVPLYLPLVRLHLKTCVQFCAPHYKKNTEGLERLQKRAVELGKSLGHKSYEEQLRELQVLSLEKRNLRGDPITLYNHLKGSCSRHSIFIKIQEAQYLGGQNVTDRNMAHVSMVHVLLRIIQFGTAWNGHKRDFIAADARVLNLYSQKSPLRPEVFSEDLNLSDFL
ncbi:hypothetical protein HGM15179_001055 [Zosterops borbonicus]|uniref:Uncharacterized protein n=1 Tax=Zosterops borbonicus TaxID=364589 RepID=A0A8K1GXA1_9PASS|nr:hypothetical protein HGM15179_001055 [Zosterops borbonicus]